MLQNTEFEQLKLQIFETVYVLLPILCYFLVPNYLGREDGRWLEVHYFFISLSFEANLNFRRGLFILNNT